MQKCEFVLWVFYCYIAKSGVLARSAKGKRSLDKLGME
jgi:hypothetical protein